MSGTTGRPSFARLADWVEGRLVVDEATRLDAAVRADPELGASAGWLTGFVELTRAMPLEEPPPLVRQRLRQHFDRWSSARAVWDRPVRIGVADLIFDSRVDRPLVDVRGAAEGDAFHLAFQSEGADVVLDVRPRPDGLLDLSGQVLLSDDDADPVFEASAVGSGAPRRCVDGDDLGRFELCGMAPQATELRLSNGELELVATLNLHPIGP